MGREYALHDGEDAGGGQRHCRALPADPGGRGASRLPTSAPSSRSPTRWTPSAAASASASSRPAPPTPMPCAARRSASSTSSWTRGTGCRWPTRRCRPGRSWQQEAYQAPGRGRTATCCEFFKDRFVNLMVDRYPSDVVDAVVAVSFDDLVDARRKDRGPGGVQKPRRLRSRWPSPSSGCATSSRSGFGTPVSTQTLPGRCRRATVQGLAGGRGAGRQGCA